MEMESEGPGADYGPTPEHQDHDEQEDDEHVPLSKISASSRPCDRCRRRKVRCDRRHPCSYCTRIDAPCTYPTRQKPKERRQRVFISEIYERKIDFIAKKLEDFGHALGNLDGQSRLVATPSTLPHHSFSNTPAPSNSSLDPQTAASSPATRDANRILTPKLEYEGESSLSAQAAFANRFLRDAVTNKPSIDITGEMASVLDNLSRTVGNNPSQQDPDYLYPYARQLEPGFDLHNLPMPPVDKAFVCLRLAKEHPRVKFFWSHEANSVSGFTDYFLKVYSPGDVTHADLIIVNAGLYWLFLECKNVMTDPEKKADFEAQATICRENLETVLSMLPFHLPSTMDTTCAMTLAGMYCLDCCKPSAAWNFLATASHMSQTLGMHNAFALAQDDPEVRAHKIKMFWLIYMQEKGLSLRLGRSSTIRDSDVTVPFPTLDTRSEAAVFGQLSKWAQMARLQGMVYDQIYSPAALVQPQAVRTARARRLARELEAHTTNITPQDIKSMEFMRQAVGDTFYKAFNCTTTMTHLSLFCLIYRAIPAEPDEGTVFGKECIETARKALEEHQRCMVIVAECEEEFLEAYVNWALLQSPFVPFTVLFCHVIETCNEDDLKRLGGLIDTLQSTSTDSFSTGIKKEVRLFKVLYDVACSYIRLKRDAPDVQAEPWGAGNSLMMPPALQPPTVLPTPESTNSQVASQAPLSQFGEAENMVGASFDGQTTASGWAPGGSFAMPGDFGMEVDQQGTQLGNWLYMNHQMIRALEDSYF